MGLGLNLPEVMKVTDFLHAEPTKFGTAQGASHVIARPVVHFGDEHLASRARLNIVTCPRTKFEILFVKEGRS